MGNLKKVVILGGSGEAGSLLSRSFSASAIDVTEVDVRPRSPASAKTSFIQADVTNIGPELRQAIQQSDCVCVCLPENVAQAAGPKIGQIMATGSLWIDTLSVKESIVKCLAGEIGRLELLSINPMFAPALGWTGNPVAVVEASAGPKSEHFKQLVTSWGARVELVGVEEHDRLTGAIQVATHAAILAFGETLRQLDYNIESVLRLASPPHRILLTVLHRLARQNPEVYWDIQAHHPHGTAVRDQLIEATRTIEADVERRNFKGFEQRFKKLYPMLEAKREILAEWERRAIEAVSDQP